MEPLTRLASARSDLYALLTRIFSFPDEEFVRAVGLGEVLMAGKAWVAALPYPGGEIPLPPGLAPPEDLSRRLGEEYLSLFELERPAACRLYEGVLMVPAGREEVLGELVRFYEHFGLQADPAREIPDHLSVELAFMRFLTAKEAALDPGTCRAGACPPPVLDVLRAERDFLARHLARFSSRVAERLAGAGPGFYADAARLLAAFVAADSAYLESVARGSGPDPLGRGLGADSEGRGLVPRPEKK